MTATARQDTARQVPPPLPPPEEPRATIPRLQWIAESLLIAVYALLAWLRRSPSLSTMNDDAFYVFLSRSLRHFSYVESFVVGSPFHVQYPPGYPAFLALVSTIFGEHHELFLDLNIAMLCGALAITDATARSRFGRNAALLVIAACALNPTLIELGGLVRSEAMFFLLWSLTLWAVMRS